MILACLLGFSTIVLAQGPVSVPEDCADVSISDLFAIRPPETNHGNRTN